jgi:hypothetical protein
MGVGGQSHAPAALPPGKTRYPLYRRLGGPQGRSGVCGKSLPTGIPSPDRPALSQPSSNAPSATQAATRRLPQLADNALQDIAHRPYQCVLHIQNVPRINMFPHFSTRKVRPFPEQIFTKLTKTPQQTSEFQLNPITKIK